MHLTLTDIPLGTVVQKILFQTWDQSGWLEFGVQNKGTSGVFVVSVPIWDRPLSSQLLCNFV